MCSSLATDFASVHSEVERILQRVARKGHTLDVPALVHEVYLRFARKEQRDGRWWRDEGHLIATATVAAAQVLSNYDRAKGREKRGAGGRSFTLNEEIMGAPALDTATFIDLTNAVQLFAREDPERVQVVWLRIYAGLSVDETADALGIGTATVKRMWRVAIARLRVLLAEYDQEDVICDGAEGCGSGYEELHASDLAKADPDES